MSEDIFTETTSNSEGNTKEGSNDETLFEIGDRKYNTEAVKTKIENADAHISKLEEENAQLRRDLETAKTIDDVLDVMNKPSDGKQETPTLSRDDLSNVVKEELEAKDIASKKEANRRTSGERLRKKFGEGAKDKMLEVGSSLNIGPQTMQDIAETSPDAFMKLFGEEPTMPATSPTTGTINTESLEQNNPGPKQGTFGYYEKLRKENPKLYHSTAVQNKMFEDAQRLGQEEFFK